jgi:hypothetical protein
LSSSQTGSETSTTTDHDEIRRWVEEHGGKPARVRGDRDDNDPGLLRIDFPGGAGEDSTVFKLPKDGTWNRL